MADTNPLAGSDAPEAADTLREKLAEAAVDAVHRHMEITDCSCDSEYDFVCWFHLSDTGRRQARIDFVATAIDEVLAELREELRGQSG